MTISAKLGPYLNYRGDPIGAAASPAPSGGQNPEAAPWMSIHGYALHDARFPFTYKPGQGFLIVGGSSTTPSVYGFLGGGKYQCIDQVPSALSANNIATSQTLTAGTAMTLTAGTGITGSTSITRADTGATVTGLFAIDTAMAGTSFSQAGTIAMGDPTKAISRNITITSPSDDSSGTAVIAGYDLYGYPMTESVTLKNNGVAASKKAFKYIASITPAGTLNSTAATVGTGDVYGLPIRADRIPYIEAWWGAPQGMITGPGGLLVPAEQTFYSPTITLSGVADANVFYLPAIPFDFTVVRVGFIVDVACTTGSKGTTFTAGINTTAMTGGVMTLSSTTMTPAGFEVGSTAITAANVGPSVTSVVTVTQASPGVFTWPNHGLVAKTPIVFTSTGTLPTGLTAGTVYYVVAGGLTTNAFEVSAAIAGTAVNTSGSPTGVIPATALNEITFTASSTTTFSEGSGRLYATVVNNNQAGSTFTAAVTSAATTTTGDVRGTISMPDNSDGTKRLTVSIAPSVANIGTPTGMFGVAQNTATNNGT